jgi:PIN domain nuclease of toxin-antitoxin system
VRFLLDTHAFLWWLAGDRQLPAAARRHIAQDDNLVFVSAASAWEIATKVRLGKLPSAADMAADIPGALASEGFAPLPVTVGHAQRAGSLPGPIRDPFDRMLIAQSLTEGLALVTNEVAFDAYGIGRIWE